MAVPFDYAGGDGVDFEPFAAFLPTEETTDWFRAWTGDGELNGDDFRVFGRDGSGGFAAFWLVRPNRALADQPVVFLGSEGRPASSRATLATSSGCWPTASALGKQPPRTSATGCHAPARSWRPSRSGSHLVGAGQRLQ